MISALFLRGPKATKSKFYVGLLIYVRSFMHYMGRLYFFVFLVNSVSSDLVLEGLRQKYF